jgi:hypothetical protein
MARPTANKVKVRVKTGIFNFSQASNFMPQSTPAKIIDNILTAMPEYRA